MEATEDSRRERHHEEGEEHGNEGRWLRSSSSPCVSSSNTLATAISGVSVPCCAAMATTAKEDHDICILGVDADEVLERVVQLVNLVERVALGGGRCKSYGR
jgi:hypothetical protein